MAEIRPGDRDRWINETLAAMTDGQPKRVRLVTGYQPPAVTLDSMMEQDMAEGARFYLLVCRECGDPARPLAVPFTSAAGRGKWAAAHTAGSGHQRWFVTEARARMPDGELAAMIARHDEERKPVNWDVAGLLETSDEYAQACLDLAYLADHGALAGIAEVIRERRRQVQEGPAEGIDGRAYQAAMLAGEIDRAEGGES